MKFYRSDTLYVRCFLTGGNVTCVLCACIIDPQMLGIEHTACWYYVYYIGTTYQAQKAAVHCKCAYMFSLLWLVALETVTEWGRAHALCITLHCICCMKAVLQGILMHILTLLNAAFLCMPRSDIDVCNAVH